MTDENGTLRVASTSSRAQVVPGLMVYRFHHSMYYANSEFLILEVLDLVNSAVPHLKWFCVDAIAIDDIDFTAAVALKEIYIKLKEKGIRLVLADVDEHVSVELERSELIGLFGGDAVFKTSADAIQAYRSQDRNTFDTPLKQPGDILKSS